MAKKETLKYDAFISYRHSQLDSFVAENIHHELEKFKLPKNLVKKRAAGEKTKITRVFRDRDELPIASDLSENITNALQNSDFLIVICTPRLKESMWCKNEIDTFISLYGRERVLAVLAEGEPVESFPESITKEKRMVPGENGEMVETIVDVEPLAADVRGKNRSEIKKKIREEVLRLAAPIFNCNYDEIKQRHREQILKRRIRIASGIAAVCLAFGSFSAYQAFKINNQGKKIKDQYSQIQEQYVEIGNQYKVIENQLKENLIKQSEIVATHANTMYEEGEVIGAKELIIDTYKDIEGDVPEQVSSNLKNSLSSILGVYRNGVKNRAITNLTMETNINLFVVSTGYKYLAAFDINCNLKIWDLESLEVVYEAETDFIGESEYTQCYGFTEDNNFIFIGEEGLYCIDCENGEEKWVADISNGQRMISVRDDEFMIASTEYLYLLDIVTGEVEVKEKINVDKDVNNIEKLLKVSDDKALVVLYDGLITFKLIDTTDLSEINSLSTEYESGVEGIVNSEGNIIFQVVKYTKDFSTDKFVDMYNICIDPATLTIKWEKETEHYAEKMYLYNNQIILLYAGGIEIYDDVSFDLKENCQIDSQITDITLISENRFRLMLKDGSMKFQNLGNLTFFENPDYYISVDKLKTYKYAGLLYAALPNNCNYITLFSRQISPYAEVVADNSKMDDYYELTEEIESEYEYEDYSVSIEDKGVYVYEDGKKVSEFKTNTNFMSGVFADFENNLLFVQYEDNSVEIRNLEDYSLIKSIDLFEEKAKLYGVYDNYLIFGDSNRSVIFNRATSGTEAVVDGFLSYNEKKNEIYFTTSIYDGDVYKVELYELKDLVKMAKD